MSTTTIVSAPGIPLVPPHTAVPPPSRQDLLDAGTVVGWIDGMAVGFHGFGHEDDAMNAAWVAYRTLSRRFARARGRRPLPIDTEPMSLERNGDVELILAGGRPIATLVRPGADSPSGPTSFGFELQVPVPADERTMRSIAYLVYRTMRRAGIRWSMWAPAPAAPSGASAGSSESATVDLPGTVAHRAAAGATADGHHAASSSSLAGALVVLTLLALIALPAITTAHLMPLLGGGAILVALLALGSLVHLVVTDVRDTRRQRGDPTATARPGAVRGRPRMLPAAGGAIQAAS
jgi:hypothetical protein